MCRSDNFGVLVHDPDGGSTIAIDAPEEAPMRQALDEQGWTLTDILITHHHGDHVAAVSALKAAFGAKVTAPASEAAKIPDVDQRLVDGERFSLGSIDFEAIETPGHTLGHLCYYLAQPGVLFAGDTLFSLGCGRVFEGTKDQMFASLQRFSALPDETLVYCGHEYTEANAKFCMSVDPNNAALQARAQDIKALREQGLATLPTTLGLERATNPFLRSDDPALSAHLGMAGAPPIEVFRELRSRKDQF